MNVLLVIAALILPPKPDGYVVDRANVMKFQDVIAVEGRLAQFERETSDQVVVYIDRDLPAGTTLEQLAPDAMRAWGIGQKGKDNGIVLFLFTNARQMRIEVGNGLHASLSESTAKHILGSVMKPKLQSGDYSGAVIDGTNAILNAIRGEPFRGSGKTVAEQRRGVSKPLIYVLAGAGAIILFVLERFLGIGIFSRRRRYYDDDDRYYGTGRSTSAPSDSSSSFESGGADGGSSGSSDSW